MSGPDVKLTSQTNKQTYKPIGSIEIRIIPIFSTRKGLKRVPTETGKPRKLKWSLKSHVT